MGEHLAVYGSLRPGGQHHRLVADLEVVGEGTVVGAVSELDGYPVLRVGEGGARVPVVVLTSDDLAGRWPELDAFEGPAYGRELVIVTLDDGTTIEASCYVAAAHRDE
jgi:gamma-glutamylcyclotransferase (GGCT)/AIG2-like uncharacterized protein YtfP